MIRNQLHVIQENFLKFFKDKKKCVDYFIERWEIFKEQNEEMTV